jgi:hypothetical protein
VVAVVVNSVELADVDVMTEAERSNHWRHSIETVVIVIGFRLPKTILLNSEKINNFNNYNK